MESNKPGARLARPSRRAIVAFTVAALSAVSSAAAANPRLLKSNVVIVRPLYHQKTRTAFRNLAAQSAKEAIAVERSNPKSAALLRKLARYWDMQSRSPGHGSGWLWIPGGGDAAFVITNKHVAGQAASVVIEFDNNRHPPIANNPVIYVDPVVDMAVIEVPKNRLPPEARGFELVERPLTEGNPIWAAGFPGTATAQGQVAAYFLTNGIVSNAEYPGIVGGAIAHTASIDPGNSGGPLLTEVPTAPLGFQVSGMNTWKSIGRTNVNLAIPASTIAKVLRSAQRSRRLASDPVQLTASLRETARRLAVELGSTRPDTEMLNDLIAYSFVAERPGLLRLPLAMLRKGTISEKNFMAFYASPVEYTRSLLWALFFKAFSTGGSRVGDVRLDAISDSVSTGRPVRSKYTIAGKTQEIFWVWEHGAWRISDASFEHALSFGSDSREKADGRRKTDGNAGRVVKKPQPKRTATTRRRSYGFHLGFAFTGASGDDFNSDINGSDRTAFELDVNLPVSRRISFVTGVGYVPHGVSYNINVEGQTVFVEEELGYVQIPALGRLDLGLSGPVGTVRAFGRAGPALDIRTSAGGEFSGAASGDLEDVDYFDEQKAVNLALVVGGGLELGLGSEPEWLFGFEVTHDRHLLGEWSDDMFFGANFSYRSTRWGFSLRYQPRR